jgi:CRISPR-associated protein (TIGR03986 family)
MSLPKQPQQIEKDRQALAPYNFVELPEQVVKVVDGEQKADMRKQAVNAALPDQDSFHAARHSGWIGCRLVTESPTYVRAALTLAEAEAGKKSKDLPEFFYVWDKREPVIPGSTLRGMLRALVEIASFSKMAEVSPARLVYRAVGDTTKHGERYRELLMEEQGKGSKSYVPKFQAGYIRRRDADWVIRPAQQINGTSFARVRDNPNLFRSLQPVAGCKNAFKIYVRVGRYDFYDVRGGFLQIKAAQAYDASEHPQTHLQEATLAKSGYIFSKRSEAVVFPEDHNAQDLLLFDEQLDAYRDQLSPEQENLLGKGGVLRDGQPVFYTLKPNGEVDFFGHCRMLRMPYRNSPCDLTPEWLRRLADIDLAEAIFGFTKGKLDARDYPEAKERHYAGRVSISDARLCDGQTNLWAAGDRVISPRILAGPKPTTFQHYLVQTQPNKIQIGTQRDGKPKYESRLSDYASPTPSETVLRGHKLYWHKGAAQLGDIEAAEKVKEKQATTMRPLRAGVAFDFRIRFDNLSDVELGALLWVLQTGADERYRLKVGMGKPLGMGAVKVTPMLRLIDRVARYTTLLAEDDWADGLQNEETSRRIQETAVAAFESFVIKQVQAPGAQRLEQLSRIRQLLALLSWPGPDPTLTRYFEIERPDPKAKRGKRNEYDGRPVLPHPFDVAGFTGKTIQTAAALPRATPMPVAKTIPAGFKRGTVKRWGLGDHASYGFIQAGSGGGDVFVHRNTLPPGVTELKVGETVYYKERKEPKRIVATELLVDR